MINKPSVLLKDDSSELTRQTQELMRSLQPVYDGAYIADKDWNDIALVAPWVNAGDLKFQFRTLIDGTVACRGRISTTGGNSKAKAVAAGNIPGSNYVKMTAAICTFPIKPKFNLFLSPQFLFAYNEDKEPFYSSCVVSIQTDGTMSLEVLLNRTEVNIAIGWLNLDFTRFL